MLKKIGTSLFAVLLLASGCSQNKETVNTEKTEVTVVERPAVSEIKKLSNLKEMIENQINSGNGFNYSETISANGASIFSFYTEDSKNHRRFRQTFVANDEGQLIKYEIDNDGKFSTYNIETEKLEKTTSFEIDNAGESARLQLLDFLRDSFDTEITEQTENSVKFDVTGFEISDAGAVFNRMNITYLAEDNGVVLYYLFSDTGTMMGFTVSFAEAGYDIGDDLEDIASLKANNE